MKTQQCLEEMQKIQSNLLGFFDNEANVEENYQNLCISFDEFKISDDLYALKSLLHLLLKLANNHHRSPNFFSKIKQILYFFKEDIIKYFSNSEIFNIFKSNKCILLYFIEENILTMDKYIINKIISTKKYLQANYLEYFSPEIKPFMNEDWFPTENQVIELINKELPENFYENRKNGENDSFFCDLIRDDLINEFIMYVNENDFSLNMSIKPSIYETNSFLIKSKNISLIEYAVFYGSFQIFQYLILEDVKLTQSLWLCSVHGKNANILHFLEDNYVKEDKTYEQCLKESIKCHHNEFAIYFKDLFEYDENSIDSLIHSLKCYNFAFIHDDLINKSSFGALCKYDYGMLVKILLQSKYIDVNETIEILKTKKFHKISSNFVNNILNSIFNKTALHLAVEKDNVDIVKLLLSYDKLDTNSLKVYHIILCCIFFHEIPLYF